MNDMPPGEQRCRGRHALTVAVIAVSLLSILVVAAQAQTEWFKNHDAGGRWHVHVQDATLVLLPLSVLLFAFGVQWAIRRKALLAIFGIAPLAAWSAIVLLHDGLLATDLYFAFAFASMSGIQPFGP